MVEHTPENENWDSNNSINGLAKYFPELQPSSDHKQLQAITSIHENVGLWWEKQEL